MRLEHVAGGGNSSFFNNVFNMVLLGLRSIFGNRLVKSVFRWLSVSIIPSSRPRMHLPCVLVGSQRRVYFSIISEPPGYRVIGFLVEFLSKI